MNVILLRNIASDYGLEAETNELSLLVMLLELLHVIRYRFGAIYIISSHQNIMSSPVFFSVGFGLLQCVVKEGLALSVHLRQTEGTNSLYQ